MAQEGGHETIVKYDVFASWRFDGVSSRCDVPIGGGKNIVKHLPPPQNNKPASARDAPPTPKQSKCRIINAPPGFPGGDCLVTV